MSFDLLYRKGKKKVIQLPKQKVKNELTEYEQIKLFEQIQKGQSLQMLSYIFKVSKQFIVKFCKLKNLVLRKECEVDYIRDLNKNNNKFYINGLLKR